MRFHLTYSGPLYATQKDPENGQRVPLAAHKHSIRKCFHVQLKHLWGTNKFLSEHRVYPPSANQHRTPADDEAFWGVGDDQKIPLKSYVASLYDRNGYQFVPLVRSEIALLCSLKVLFLRHDRPGTVLQAGDIDNRLKTLIDTLRMPMHAQELVGNEMPGADESPFFVLLEDDKQVTHFEVETDTLLEPPSDIQADRALVRLVLAVEIRPYDVTMFNLAFAG